MSILYQLGMNVYNASFGFTPFVFFLFSFFFRYQNICNNNGYNQKYAIVQFSIIVRLFPQSLAI